MDAAIIQDEGIPSGLTDVGEAVASNCDHSFNAPLAERLKHEPVFSQYAGWHFCGYVWFGAGQYHCAVYTYKSYRETISAATMEDLMTAVSDNYGYE